MVRLDANDVIINVRINNVDADAFTASVNLDIDYRLGKSVNRKSGIKMQLTKEDEDWKVKSEGL